MAEVGCALKRSLRGRHLLPQECCNTSVVSAILVSHDTFPRLAALRPSPFLAILNNYHIVKYLLAFNYYNPLISKHLQSGTIYAIALMTSAKGTQQAGVPRTFLINTVFIKGDIVMISWQDSGPQSLFVDEHASIAYIFDKRWPCGFQCPFCKIIQKEMAASLVVTCQHCHKQTSLTAHTTMHGSKKSLVAWLMVARQFCRQRNGLSARQLQRLFELSCYQTAWKWLQKIRHGAAIAEAAPCSGVVLFDIADSGCFAVIEEKHPVIAMATRISHVGIIRPCCRPLPCCLACGYLPFCADCRTPATLF